MVIAAERSHLPIMTDPLERLRMRARKTSNRNRPNHSTISILPAPFDGWDDDKPLMTLNKAVRSIDVAIPGSYVILQLVMEGSLNLAMVRHRQLSRTV
ncbi:MAG: hypothetical protein KGL35_12215 [Bradyrhizobium sp.]|nr:hypothetical protein [Pseudomonadota bacterium]MDE2469480.1 hypothetical protein [Bradyrhizobium sp.]